MPFEWKTLCCPIDFSEPARAALELAVDLCNRLGADLVLLHVDTTGKLAEERSSGEPIDVLLGAWEAEARRLGARQVTVQRTRGQPELAIVEHVRRRHIDALVMGTHARTDREAMLTGSVTEGVVRNAPCPVVTVRGRPEARAPDPT